MTSNMKKIRMNSLKYLGSVAKIFENPVIFPLVLIALTLICIVISLGLGFSPVSYDRIIPNLIGMGTDKENMILYQIRLPRIMITVLAGMALALSGVILQSITQNELADPGILGINAGAGVAIAFFYLFVPVKAGEFSLMLPLVAFLGALITSALTYGLAWNRNSGTSPMRLVVVGICFSMALSGLMVVLVSAADREKVDFIAKWLSGSLWGADWPFIALLIPWLIIILPFTLYKATVLDLFGLSEIVATSVGLKVNTERVMLLLAAVGLASSAVALAGSISFIGLMAPHIARAITGPRHEKLIPSATLIGGLLLLIADTIGRNIMTSSGMPAGIIVSLIGAPYFVYLLTKKE